MFFFLNHLMQEIVLGHYEAEQSRRMTYVVGDMCSCLYIPVCSVFVTVWLHRVTLTLLSALFQIFLWRAVVRTLFPNLYLYSWLFVGMWNNGTLSHVEFQSMSSNDEIISYNLVFRYNCFSSPPDLCAANFNKHVLYLLLSFTNVSVD